MNTAVAYRVPFNWVLTRNILGAIALAVITAILTYYCTARLNVETAVQQQNASAIQRFEETGAQMDADLSLFIDTVLDKKGSETARKDARTAIALHAAQTASLTALVGNDNVKSYLLEVGKLRNFVDKVNGPKTGKIMAQQHVDLMDFRVRLVSLAKGNVYRS